MTICALGGTGERRAQDHQRAPGPDGAGLPAAVDPDAGPRAHRVDAAAVRAGRHRDRAGLGTEWPGQPQLAPPFSFNLAPRSVAPGVEVSFDLAPPSGGIAP